MSADVAGAGSRPDRGWMIGGALAAAALVAAAWFLFISPEISAGEDFADRQADAQMHNATLRNKLALLNEQNEHIAELTDELDAAQSVVPPRHRLEEFTRQLSDAALAAGVSVTSISPGQPVALSTNSEDVAADNADTVAAGDQDSDAANTAAADGAAEDTPAPTQPDAVGRTFSIPVTVVTTGTADAQRALLAAIESQQERLSLLIDTQLTVQEDTSADESDLESEDGSDSQINSPSDSQSPLWEMTTNMYVFVAPRSPTDVDDLAQRVSAPN